MTATLSLSRAASEPSSRRRRGGSFERVRRSDLPPMHPRLHFVRAVLATVLVLSLTILLELIVVSGFQQSATQEQRLDAFRSKLALGTAPIGPTDQAGDVLALGTSVAVLEIPRIGVRQVVGEGTTSGVLFDGPGHRRDTPLPGQIGTSIVYGRRAAFGGPFSDIAGLHAGDRITVATGQGAFEFEVIDVRHAGDPTPPRLSAGGSRLTLMTADGQAFLPAGVVRVDADLQGEAVVGPARARTSATLPDAERPMAGDGRMLWVLAFWLQALLLIAIGGVWAWHRWGRAQAWVVFLPAMLLVGLGASSELIRLLPNLM